MKEFDTFEMGAPHFKMIMFGFTMLEHDIAYVTNGYT